MIAQKSIQEVLNTAQVEEVVGEFVNLKRRGVNRIGLCPFHDEKTPSFTVSPGKNIYKCFGCGKGGNSAQFLMEAEKMTFVEAIRYLSNKYNITLEESGQNNEEYAEEKKHLDSLFIVNDFAAQYFEEELQSEEGRSIGLSYFRERGYRDVTIQKFGLGYSSKKRDSFTEKALLKQYKTEYLRELGLMTARGQDFFNARVMFTIHNLSGKPIAFAGRILTENKKAPKYLNSPESVVYNKRKILYGMYQAKNAIRKEDNCILVEGYTDVISLSQSGVENVVASSGTALTDQQLRLVKRFTDNLTILYDGDKAGIKAALKGMDLALEADLNPRIALLPPEDDPDSFIKREGYEKFKSYLAENAKDFILFKLDLSLEDAKGDPIKKAGIIRGIVESISKIRDTIKRSTYIQQCSSMLRVDERIIVKETNKLIRESIRRNKIQKDREKQRSQNSSSPSKSQSSSQAGFPDVSNQQDTGFQESEFPESGFPDADGFQRSDEEDYYEKQEPKTHKQKPLEPRGDVYQEKDLVRIIITYGASIIKDEEGDQNVAQYIYSNIAEVIEYFDNDIYKNIILEAVQRSEEGLDISSQYFTNHQDQEKQSIAVELISTRHSYASWDKRGVHLVNQKAPSENFTNDSFQSIIIFKFRKIKRIMTLLEDKIKTAEKDNKLEEVKQLLLAYRKLQEERIKIAGYRGMVFG